MLCPQPAEQFDYSSDLSSSPASIRLLEEKLHIMPKTQTAPNPGSTVADTLKDGPLDVFKARWLFLGISLIFLLPGLFFIVKNCMDPEIQAPVRLGIDFRGGTLLEYGFSKPVVQADVNAIRLVFDQHGYTGSVIQIQQPRVGINKQVVEIGNHAKSPEPNTTASSPVAPNKLTNPNMPPTETAVTQTPDTGKIATIVSIRSKQLQGDTEQLIRQDLAKKYGNITLLQKNSIGPALAKELLSNGLLALVMAYILIVGYLTVRFQFDFAVCAMAALVHDTVFLIGMFALFGALFHTEVDSLFITAVLTVVGFSVHDTIVVFDRIRENNRLYFTKKVPFVKIVNMSINQTMARSINTSLTALLTMLALYLFGGETTRDFVLAIIIGIAAGTYSSIFNASVLLAMWRNKAVPVQTSAPVAI
jgi:preprotein translocase subunit SecF